MMTLRAIIELSIGLSASQQDASGYISPSGDDNRDFSSSTDNSAARSMVTEREYKLLVFEVKDGKASAKGYTLRPIDHSKGVTPEELMKLLEFLEGFSVAEWDKKQEQIKKQFE